jgi:hypothetical protein
MQGITASAYPGFGAERQPSTVLRSLVTLLLKKFPVMTCAESLSLQKLAVLITTVLSLLPIAGLTLYRTLELVGCVVWTWPQDYKQSNGHHSGFGAVLRVSKTWRLNAENVKLACILTEYRNETRGREMFYNQTDIKAI